MDPLINKVAIVTGAAGGILAQNPTFSALKKANLIW